MSGAQDAMAQAVALHRDDPPSSLTFRPPFQALMDRTHCGAWSGEIGQHGTAWEVRKASADLWQHLPSGGGLYMFVWRPQFPFVVAGEAAQREESFGWIVYVGMTGAGDSKGTFKSRYRSEYASYIGGDPASLFGTDAPSGRKARLSRYLTMQPLEYWFTEIEDRSRIARLERELIRTFSPPLNDIHARVRKGATVPAFRSY